MFEQRWQYRNELFNRDLTESVQEYQTTPKASIEYMYLGFHYTESDHQEFGTAKKVL